METLGLLLFTGGAATRLGGRKCSRPHPEGGSWGGHLVRTFRAISEGPVRLLGDPLPDHPDLPRLDDPREGPAAALRVWAATAPGGADRWLLVACDQVRWTAPDLQVWQAAAEAADPGGRAWVMARSEGIRQYFGSWIPSALLPKLTTAPGASLRALADALPTLVLEWDCEGWRDLDTPEDLSAYERERP